MPGNKGCLCWRDVKTVSVATGIFSMTMSSVQILIQIAMWTSLMFPSSYLQNPMFILYIPLAALDFLLVLSAMVMLVGLEKGKSGRGKLVPWIGLSVVYLLYEAAVNLYFFSLNFSALVQSKGAKSILLTSKVVISQEPELAMLFIYWVIKLFIYVMGLYRVISCYNMLDNKYPCKPQKPWIVDKPFEYPRQPSSRMDYRYPGRDDNLNFYNRYEEERRPFDDPSRLYTLDPELLRPQEDPRAAPNPMPGRGRHFYGQEANLAGVGDLGPAGHYGRDNRAFQDGDGGPIGFEAYYY